MAKGKIKTKTENQKASEWLLGFEKHIGKPCVVSLLIENGNVDFISCWSKTRLDDLKDEGEEEHPKNKANNPLRSLDLDESYFG